ncbi:kinase-like protein [Pholiota conissans]|uniref:Kinase-like protein n=1 Tax=Pholiota conissans TaxID=109636 RepID=A0A9P6CP62_9AGAR|nr:kinase-like protein [Pholiota conissans]
MNQPRPLDWVGVEDPWVGVTVDLNALRHIVCEVLRVSATECGEPTAIGLQHQRAYARVYMFKLPGYNVVARLVAPLKPLFKTEGEVGAMDFVRSATSLPVPKVFAYCSEATNPVGVEWVLMEYMPGIEMGDAWDGMTLTQKRRLALDLVDLYDQLSRLRAAGIGSIYHSVYSVDDRNIVVKSIIGDKCHTRYPRSPRWRPLSAESLTLLKTHCSYPVKDGYNLGPLNDISILNYKLSIPSYSQTMPVFTTEEYVRLVSFNGNPTTRSDFDLPTREKFVELFQSLHTLYCDTTVLGPRKAAFGFCFSHGDLHEGNIFIDPQSGEITGIIDWEAAAFRPMWEAVSGVGWFAEDTQRFIYSSEDPENFADDTTEDAKLRAFFRNKLYDRNPDLFSCFYGGIELRAILAAATDIPRPIGQSELFLRRYYYEGYWNEARRGPFPWNMLEWQYKRVYLDRIEMKRLAALSEAASHENHELMT